MSAFIRFLTAIFLAGLLSACSNSPVIRSDYDSQADFASYRTFAFMEPLGTNQGAWPAAACLRGAAAPGVSAGFACPPASKTPDPVRLHHPECSQAN